MIKIIKKFCDAFSITNIIGILYVGTVPVSAQEDDTGNNNSFIIAGAGTMPEFEGSNDKRLIPFVVSRFSVLGADIEIDGLQGRFNFVKDSIWRAGPAISFTIPRSGDFDSTASLLPKVDLAVEVGGFVGFEIPFSTLKEGRLSGFISARQDVTGSHDGFIVTAEIEYFFALNRMMRFGIAANTSFGSEKYMNNYFSVSQDNALLSGLSEFNAGAGLKDVGVEIISIVSFSPKWGIFSRIAYNRLINNAIDSPVTETPNQYFFGGGLLYRF